MEITRKIFWTEAMKGGTIIGLAVTAFKLAQSSLGLGLWIGMVSLAVFILLLYGFTKKIATMASAEDGFPFNRCMGFVLAMMIFVGVIQGVYQTIMNTLVDTEIVVSAIDSSMAMLQDVYTPAQFDVMYDTTYKMMFNPLAQVFVGVFAYFIQGGIAGLFVSVFAQRKPNIFATSNNDNTQAGDEK